MKSIKSINIRSMLNLKFLTLFILLITFDMMGESTLYNMGHSHASFYNPYVILGILSYSIAAFMYFQIAHFTPLLVINTYWHMTIFSIMTLMGIFYFKNKLTFARGLGLVFAAAAIFCMYLSNIHGL